MRNQPRFIPAGAGNTGVTLSTFISPAVYPRWRGEHRVRRGVVCALGGLSPLARGTRFGSRSGGVIIRFIPAGAGNTLLSWFARCSSAVYPRWRGEHRCTPARRRYSSGLSPLARGTRRAHPSASQRVRFIPAGAGNTRFSGMMASGPAVYPRWRGEHSSLISP